MIQCASIHHLSFNTGNYVHYAQENIKIGLSVFKILTKSESSPDSDHVLPDI